MSNKMIVHNFIEVAEIAKKRGNYGNLSGLIFDFVVNSEELIKYIEKNKLEQIDFSKSDFRGEVRCDKTDFSECDLIFTACRFFDLVELNKNIFKRVDFSKAIFKETASFIGAKFCDVAEFTHTEFCGVTLFRGAQFKKCIKFTETKFEKCAQFDSLKTYKLTFDNCKAAMGFEFKEHVPDPKRETNPEHEPGDSRKSDSKQEANGEDGLLIKALSFKDSLIGDSTDLDWEKDKVYDLLVEGNKGEPNGDEDLVKQLGVLKGIYNHQGDYHAEDEVFVKMMQKKKEICFKRKDQRKDQQKEGKKEGKKRLNIDRIKGLIYGLSGAISGYGTSPLRVFITMLISIVGFGAIYFFIGLANSQITIDILINAMHGMFAPIGDAGIAVQIVSCVQCLWGMLLLSFLSATIIRRIIR